MKKMPQPIPYQGSKRKMARQILAYFPDHVTTLVEPFAGSAAISVAAAYHRKATHFYLNDINEPLMRLLEMIINEPKKIADRYEKLWNAQLGREKAFYNEVRAKFNQTQRPADLLYLLARCVKAAVRYNSNGDFNQSPDNRRKGRRPATMRQEIMMVSNLLQGRTKITSTDYKEVLDSISKTDLVYMDPPYQGTSGRRDKRYYSGVPFDELVEVLETLNHRRVMFILSYDGRRGGKRYGQTLPDELGLHQFEIQAGRSTQSTLLGGKDLTFESLYLSDALVARLDHLPNRSNHHHIPQINLAPKQLEFNFL